MSVWVWATHAQMALQARRESQMSWSYSYKWLELSDTGLGPLEKQQVLSHFRFDNDLHHILWMPFLQGTYDKCVLLPSIATYLHSALN